MRLELSANNLFSHMLALGLASMLDEDSEIESPVLMRWGSPQEVEIIAGDGHLDERCAARAVRRFICAVAECESSLAATEVVSGASHSPASPRIAKKLTDDEWVRYFSARRNIVDEAESSVPLFAKLVCSLGFPCYWSELSTVKALKGNLDIGASVWEMAPRNSGSEFMKNKYFKMLRSIAGEEDDAIVARLVGAEANSDGESRNACGFHAPGSEDTLRAWIALHGMASFDVRPVTHRSCSAISSGVVRDDTTRATYFVLPVPDSFASLQRYRAIARNASCHSLARFLLGSKGGGGSRSTGSASMEFAVQWLSNHGVAALALFPRKKGGTQNCPEYYAMEGSIRLLEEVRR